MGKKKKKIIVPFEIPKNIRNAIEDYRNWIKGYPIPGYTKLGLLTNIEKVCRRWHLYKEFQASAGTFWIITNIGVTIRCYSNREPLEYEFFDGRGMSPSNVWIEKRDGITYKYVRKP